MAYFYDIPGGMMIFYELPYGSLSASGLTTFKDTQSVKGAYSWDWISYERIIIMLLMHFDMCFYHKKHHNAFNKMNKYVI